MVGFFQICVIVGTATLLLQILPSLFGLGVGGLRTIVAAGGGADEAYRLLMLQHPDHLVATLPPGLHAMMKIGGVRVADGLVAVLADAEGQPLVPVHRKEDPGRGATVDAETPVVANPSGA